jgi:hypothetical protein
MGTSGTSTHSSGYGNGSMDSSGSTGMHHGTHASNMHRSMHSSQSANAQNGEVARLNEQSLQAAREGRPFMVGSAESSGSSMSGSMGGAMGSSQGAAPSSYARTPTAAGAMNSGEASSGAQPGYTGTQQGASAGMGVTGSQYRNGVTAQTSQAGQPTHFRSDASSGAMNSGESTAYGSPNSYHGGRTATDTQPRQR